MNSRGHFWLALGLSLAVHALALAAVPWLGPFARRAPANSAFPATAGDNTHSRQRERPLLPKPPPESASSPRLSRNKPLHQCKQLWRLCHPNHRPLNRVSAAQFLRSVRAFGVATPQDLEPAVQVQSEAVTVASPDKLTACRNGGRGQANFSHHELVCGSGDDLDGPIIAPAYRRNPPPRYPSSARRRAEEGLVLLQVMVNERGRPAHIRVMTSFRLRSLGTAPPLARCVAGNSNQPAARASQ